MYACRYMCIYVFKCVYVRTVREKDETISYKQEETAKPQTAQVLQI